MNLSYESQGECRKSHILWQLKVDNYQQSCLMYDWVMTKGSAALTYALKVVC